jgi:sensor histidine kinase YesM
MQRCRKDTFDRPWPDVIRGELAGIMPWAFVAPIILAMSRWARIDRLGLARFLGAHLLGMLAAFFPYLLIRLGVSTLWIGFAKGWVPSNFTTLRPTWPNLVGLFIEVPFMYLLILLGAEAMKQAQARQEEERQAGRLAGQLAEARLALLQRQLQPHFLFNALQAISTLLHRDPVTADALLVRLSTLLRVMLDQASGQSLKLRTELELTRKYLEIEQVRFADRLTVEWEVDESLLDIQVPSLIVLPLVDNAIRHGLSPKVGPGCLKIAARQDGASLILTVADDGLGTTLPLRSGVGIGNTRERLATLYGEAAGLDIDTRATGGFSARILIPLPKEQP